MKTILLMVTILLLVDRILTTPRSLSEKAYKKYVEKEIKTMSDNFSKVSARDLDIIKLINCFIALIFYIIVFWYYLYIGNKFPNNILYLLSVIQTLTVLKSFWSFLNSNPFSTNPEDYNFNRWYRLFNVILDYIYYPMVLYILL